MQTQTQKGQGLVEFVIVLIVLGVLFLGMAEVAVAMHAQLLLINRTREVARYAAKGVKEENVQAYAEQLFRDEAYFARVAYFTVTITGTTMVSFTVGTTDTLVLPPIDDASFIECEQEVAALYEAEPDFTAMFDFVPVVVDVAMYHAPVTRFFGVRPMALRSRSVFRVAPGRR